MKSFGNAVGRESGIGGSMESTPHPKKTRIGRRRNPGIETMTARETEMSGTEVGTAADQNETEAQSAAAEEMNQRVLDTARKMQPPLQGPPGRRRTVAMALQGALSGKHPPQHLPIGTLSGVIGRPHEIETGL